MSRVRIAVWNTEWAMPDSVRGQEIVRRLTEVSADVICVTEGHVGVLPGEGHVIESEPDYGYRLRPGRRKVLLWSHAAWEEVNSTGSASLPGGRFIEGVTDTPVGRIRVVGVCVPWRDAHVRTGRRDRDAWQDHTTYLQALREVIARRSSVSAELVVGDFNQRIPRTGVPEKVFGELIRTFEGRYLFATEGELEGADGLAIDHVAHTPNLARKGVRTISPLAQDGTRLSDHFGLVVDLMGLHEAPPG